MHCIKFYYYYFQSTPTCFDISSFVIRGVYQSFLMLAGSMFYIHLLHNSSAEWHYALNGENIPLFSGLAQRI
jgi:hypothetical protein